MCRGGFTMNGTKKKRLISSLVVLTLILGLFIGVRVSNTTISDDSVPLSGDQIPATFYVYNPSWQNIWTYFCDYVGEGSISEKVSVDNDAAYVNSLITSAPDYSASYPGYYIEWRTIYLMRNKTYVVGFFCEPPITDEASDEASDENVTEVDSSEVDEIVDEVIDMIEEQNPNEVIEESEIEEVPQEPVTITLNREQILSASADDYSANTVLKWDKFRVGKKDTYDGSIPIELLDDDVYCSMNLPSESLSDTMISAWRDNGHIVDYIDGRASRVLSMGAIYPTSGVTITSNVTICLGKIKMFAYSASKQQWITLDNQPYPAGIYLYKMPWTSASQRIKPDIDYSNGYAKITLTPEQLNGYCLHFWGVSQEISDDYIYYATAYDAWCENTDYVTNSLTMTVGADAKASDRQTTTGQLFSSRGLTLTDTVKTSWGHTIPADSYTEEFGTTLEMLFNQ